MQRNGDSNGQPDVEFTVDGVSYTSEDRRRTAAELLSMAGVNGADHDLARVVGRGEIDKRFADEETVQLTPGAKYVTIFTGPTPVV